MYEALVSQLVKVKLTPNRAEGTRENLVILKNTSLAAESRAAAHTASREPHCQSVLSGKGQ
jgi:hypothetical protein